MSGDKTKLNYVKSITDIFTKDEQYFAYANTLAKGKSEAKLIHRHNIKKLDLEWVKVIEECLVSLDTIVRNPRKFIVIEEDIIDISLARSITTESVKHLAQHTNLISSVDKNGMVLPNKILNTSKEESYEVYENRFIYTLLLKLRDFVAKRFDLIKKAYLIGDETLEISVDSAFNVGSKKLYYKQNIIAALPSKEALDNNSDLTNLERISKISRIISDFLSSPFAKQMVSSALIRPPIQRTNVILKNHDFKKALMLWQFIETYDKIGFEVESKDDSAPLDTEIKNRFLEIQYLNKLLFDAITADKELADGVDIVIDNKLKDINTLLEDKDATENMPKDLPANDKNEDKKDAEGDTGENKQQADLEKSEDDDYPQIAFDVPEIISIYEKNLDEKHVNKTDIKRINLAVDRALLQQRIEKQKANKQLSDKLRAQRKKTEAKQKELAKRAKLAREKKALRKSLQRERAKKREEEQKLLMQKREERMREVMLRAQKKAVLEEQKRLFREKAEETKRINEQKAAEYKQILEQKAALEKQRIIKQENAALIKAEKAIIAKNLKAKQNKANIIAKIKLENYKKALHREYEKDLADLKEDIRSKSAIKLEALETVLEEFNTNYYAKGKKKG